MKKVVLASFLALAVLALGLPFAFAQGAPAGAAAPADPCAAAQMADAEVAVYNNANTQTDPKAKAAAFEQYLTQFPQSAVKATALETIMVLDYSVSDFPKALDAADRLLQINPGSIKGLFVETQVRNTQATALTDAAAKQALLDPAAAYAQKGLAATKPACMSDADFNAQKGSFYPTFYSAIGNAASGKKDSATAIDAFKKEFASVPEAQTHVMPVLLDTYQLALTYLQSTPPDYLNCAFYAARFTGFAPEPFKSQVAATAKYCYKRYHGGDDGYDAVLAAATSNLNPPADFASTIKPAPTPAEQIHTIITSTPPDQLGSLATADKEMVFQYGSPEDAAKVWDSIKGKSVQIPGALVIASTPTQLQVAVDVGAAQNKTADFTFNLKAPDPLPEHATAAQKAAYDKNQAAIADATQVGKTVTVQGTYDSFTPSPLMITMSDGEVVLPKPTKPAPKTTPKPASKGGTAGHRATTHK
jgi:tetratricopeptide (TPR) repeat protein